MNDSIPRRVPLFDLGAKRAKRKLLLRSVIVQGLLKELYYSTSELPPYELASRLIAKGIAGWKVYSRGTPRQPRVVDKLTSVKSILRNFANVGLAYRFRGKIPSRKSGAPQDAYSLTPFGRMTVSLLLPDEGIPGIGSIQLADVRDYLKHQITFRPSDSQSKEYLQMIEEGHFEAVRRYFTALAKAVCKNPTGKSTKSIVHIEWLDGLSPPEEMAYRRICERFSGRIWP